MGIERPHEYENSPEKASERKEEPWLRKTRMQTWRNWKRFP